jgi:hypothetical protein
MCARRPEFSTEIVEASTIASWVRPGSPANRAEPISTATARLRLTTTVRLEREGKDRGTDGDADPDQHEAEAEGQRQIAFACLEHDRCRHRPGIAGDVAADHQHGADLRDRPAETGENGGDHPEPLHREQVGNRP